MLQAIRIAFTGSNRFLSMWETECWKIAWDSEKNIFVRRQIGLTPETQGFFTSSYHLLSFISFPGLIRHFNLSGLQQRSPPHSWPWFSIWDRGRQEGQKSLVKQQEKTQIHRISKCFISSENHLGSKHSISHDKILSEISVGLLNEPDHWKWEMYFGSLP